MDPYLTPAEPQSNVTVKCKVKGKSIKTEQDEEAEEKAEVPPKDARYDDFIDISVYSHCCAICNKRYSTSSNLYKHYRVVHKCQIATQYASNIKCSECGGENFSQMAKLIAHLKVEHSISIEKEELKFNTESEFLSWKSTIENSTSSVFVKPTGVKKKCRESVVKQRTYSCFRSGKFMSRSRGKRNLKAQGSNKIGVTCPAQIIVLYENNNTLSVHFYKTHLGHNENLDENRMLMAKMERKRKRAQQRRKRSSALRTTKANLTTSTNVVMESPTRHPPQPALLQDQALPQESHPIVLQDVLSDVTSCVLSQEPSSLVHQDSLTDVTSAANNFSTLPVMAVETVQIQDDKNLAIGIPYLNLQNVDVDIRYIQLQDVANVSTAAAIPQSVTAEIVQNIVPDNTDLELEEGRRKVNEIMEEILVELSKKPSVQAYNAIYQSLVSARAFLDII